jgi:hypothetical protein
LGEILCKFLWTLGISCGETCPNFGLRTCRNN